MRILLAVFAVSLSGCVNLSPADPAGDVVISEFVDRTMEVIEAGDEGRLSLDESRHFLEQSQAKLEAVRARARGARISAKAQGNLDALDRQYAVLLKLKKPLRTSNSEELQTTLLALRDMKPFTAGWRRVRGHIESEPSTTESSETPSDSEKEKCKKKHDKNKDRCEQNQKHHKKS